MHVPSTCVGLLYMYMYKSATLCRCLHLRVGGGLHVVCISKCVRVWMWAETYSHWFLPYNCHLSLDAANLCWTVPCRYKEWKTAIQINVHVRACLNSDQCYPPATNVWWAAWTITQALKPRSVTCLHCFCPFVTLTPHDSQCVGSQYEAHGPHSCTIYSELQCDSI